MDFLPFRRDFEVPIVRGWKIMTCRTKAYGKPLDELRTDFGMVRLLFVEKVSLGFVADYLFSYEGCTSSSHFISIWEKLHYKYHPEQVVYLHVFELFDKATPPLS